MMNPGFFDCRCPLVSTRGFLRRLVPADLGKIFQLTFLGSLLLLSSTRWVSAETPASAFDAANKLYEQSNYRQAAEAYKTLVQKGQVSAPLYFNWGNALFKAGQLGQAIYAYQRAEALAPRDPDIRANLQFARNKVQAPTLLPERAVRWLGKLTLTEWTWMAAATLWTWLLLLAAMQWRPALKPTLQNYVVWGGLFTLIVCACFAGSFYFHRLDSRAIVIVPETNARLAPLDESQSAFTLHDGAELQVLDQKDQWLQVRIDPRRSGWIRKDDVVTPNS
jgi:tetratricopeptide (TPR) repeat protein